MAMKRPRRSLHSSRHSIGVLVARVGSGPTSDDVGVQGSLAGRLHALTG